MVYSVIEEVTSTGQVQFYEPLQLFSTKQRELVTEIVQTSVQQILAGMGLPAEFARGFASPPRPRSRSHHALRTPRHFGMIEGGRECI